MSKKKSRNLEISILQIIVVDNVCMLAVQLSNRNMIRLLICGYSLRLHLNLKKAFWIVVGS